MFDLRALEAVLAGTILRASSILLRLQTLPTPMRLKPRARAPSMARFTLPMSNWAGRGRGDHGWRSAAGEGLYVSVLLRPAMEARRLPLLPLAAGLAAADAIRADCGLEADLRWPNDLMIGLRKAGGILVESKTEAGKVAFAVVGIGINVHQREFAPDCDASNFAGSGAGYRVSRQPLLVSLLKSLEREAGWLADAAAGKTIPRRVEAASTWVRGDGLRCMARSLQWSNSWAGRRWIPAGGDGSGLVTVQTGGIRASCGGRRLRRARMN